MKSSFPAPEYPLKPIFSPWFCRSTLDIYNLNGYNKSACFMNMAYSYDQHRLYSLRRDLRFFKMNSDVANNSVINLFSMVRPWNGYSFFVGNREGSRCFSLRNPSGIYNVATENCSSSIPAAYEYINIERKFYYFNRVNTASVVDSKSLLNWSRNSDYRIMFAFDL